MQKNALESFGGERTPFKDLTNTGANETKSEQHGSGANLYGRLSNENKEMHLATLQIARQEKKNATPSIGKIE